MTRTSRNLTVGLIVTLGLAGIGWTVRGPDLAVGSETPIARRTTNGSEVLEWNQIFIDTLIATNTANSSSQRLGAIVHTAIFDAYNGIERRYTPIFVHEQGPPRRVAPSGGHRRGVHGAGRPVPVATAGARCQLCGFARGAERRLRDSGHRADDGARARRASSAASPGEPRSRRPCSPGARPMGSARATLRSPVGPRSASGGRHRRRSDR